MRWYRSNNYKQKTESFITRQPDSIYIKSESKIKAREMVEIKIELNLL